MNIVEPIHLANEGQTNFCRKDGQKTYYMYSLFAAKRTHVARKKRDRPCHFPGLSDALRRNHRLEVLLHREPPGVRFRQPVPKHRRVHRAGREDVDSDPFRRVLQARLLAKTLVERFDIEPFSDFSA